MKLNIIKTKNKPGFIAEKNDRHVKAPEFEGVPGYKCETQHTAYAHHGPHDGHTLP